VVSISATAIIIAVISSVRCTPVNLVWTLEV